MLHEQFAELKLTGSLPSPTGVGLAILRITSADDYSINDISQAIAADPGLTGRILRLANSAVHAALEPARTVDEAAMRIGVRTVRNVALGFSLVSNNRSGPCEGFDYEAYWSHSLACAAAAQVLAPRFRDIVPAEAFTCALLSGIGRITLASVHPEEFTRVLARAGGASLEELVALEREAFELDHSQLAAAMLADWLLPESFSRAVAEFEAFEPDGTREPDAVEPMVELLWCAATVAAALLGSGGRESGLWTVGDDALDTVRQRVELDEAGFGVLCDRMAEHHGEWSALLQVPPLQAVSARELLERARTRRQEGGVTRAPANADSAASRGKPLTILAVDDDKVALRLLVRHLSREGHSVLTSENGDEALALALETNPDLVLTDWMMPKMDGIELCRALRRTTAGRGMVVLVLTGQDQEERIVEAFDAGADDYVVKPFNPRVLMARVRSAQRVIDLRRQVEGDKASKSKQVAKMAVLNRKLRSAAMTDALTGLPNRRFATRFLEQEVAQAQRSEVAMSVIMVDIDHFKRVNDEFGHHVGDVVLCDTAAILRRNMRRGDVICRLGGEEFIVICRGSDLDDAAVSAERLRAAVEGHTIRGGGFNRAVAVSMGVAELRETDGTVDDLLKASDRRVYIAKALGRNRVVSTDEGEPHSLTA